MARGDRQAAQGKTPLVRVLYRRTGIDRRVRNQQIEIEEVFKIDIIPHLFEGEEPPLKVTFVLTQEKDKEMELDYPLELPEEEFRKPNKALVLARRVYAIVYGGDFDECIALEHQYHHSVIGSTRSVFRDNMYNLDIGQWKDLTPEDFLSFWHLSGLNGGLVEYNDQEEIELMQGQLEFIFTKYPKYCISVLPIMTDFVQLMFFMAEICRLESLPSPN